MPPVRPNIILVMCDDLGWGDVGFNGHPKVRTPNLDRLSAAGRRLDRFYAAAPVCSPTRASALTGRNPFRMGIYHANTGHMLPEEVTLAEVLRSEGYRTGMFGKWHLGTLTTMLEDANRGRPRDSTNYALPTDHGFDAYFCTESKTPTWDPMLKPDSFRIEAGESLRYGWAALEQGSERVPKTYGTFYWSGPEQMALHNLDGDDSRVIMDRVLPFVEDAVARQQPFFSTVWFHTPHLPLVTSRHHRDQYADLSLQEQLLYGSISAMDEQVGRLWAKLEELGVAENTMLWFCSDNGPENRTPGSSGPFRERKRSLYEGGVRVPAFLVWPAHFEGGQNLAAPMVTSDYLPTILDYLQLDYPQPERPIDGKSMRPVLEGERNRRDHPIGFQFRNKISWVTDQYKLISTDEGESFELYDLLMDPEEKQDLSKDRPLIVNKLSQELQLWLDDCRRSDRDSSY